MRLHDRRERERAGRTLVEGARETARALDAGIELETVLLAPTLLRTEGSELQRRLAVANVSLLELSEAAFARLSRRQGPDGVIAIARTPRRLLGELELSPDALLLVAVGTQKPGNLGALLRSADAAGVQAVILDAEAGTDPWNPSVVRTSMGSVFSLTPVVADGEEIRTWLAQHGVRLVASSPAAEPELWEVDLTGALAIVVGPEHEGLDAAWLDRADSCVRIPMAGAADSLNVAVSGALLLFEAVRQRRSG